jgi:hypothetical protein
MSQDHGTIRTSAHTASYDRHKTNTVHVRNIHGRHGIVRVYTVSHCLVRSYTAFTLARKVQKTQLPAVTLQAHRPLQLDPDELEDQPVIPMSPRDSDSNASSVDPKQPPHPRKKDTFYIALPF